MLSPPWLEPFVMAPPAAIVAIGALAAFAWSALLGYVTLAMRRFRNARLFARDEPTLRDCIYPLPIVWFGTGLGAAATVIATLLGAAWQVTIASAAIAASPPFLLMIGAALVSAFPRAPMRP